MFTKCLESGVLKSGAPYAIGVLSPSRIDLSDELQHKIKDSLPEDQKQFTVLRSLDTLNGNTIIACESGGALIGQCMVHYPRPGDGNTHLPGWNLPLPVEKWAVLEGMSVMREYRDQGLGKMLDLHRRSTIPEDRIPAVEIELSNAKNLGIHMKHGMFLVEAAVSPDDGAEVAYLAKLPGLAGADRLAREALPMAGMTVGGLKQWLGRGYYGCGVDHAMPGAASLIIEKLAVRKGMSNAA